MQNAKNGRSERPCISTNNESVATFLQAFTLHPKKSVRQCSRETGIPKTSVHRILRHVKYVTKLLHVMNEDNPDCRMEFVSGFCTMRDKRESFPVVIIWSDKAT
jgi:hypothetical protein